MMIQFKLWRTASAAALIGVGALAGCGQPPGAPAPAEPASKASAPEAGGEAGEAAVGEAGGEHGEAGAASAYAGLEGPARAALRLQHLKGFVLIARRVADSGTAEEAGALVGQGLLEVYAPAEDQFGALDVRLVRAAETAGMDGKPKAEVTRAIDAAARAIASAQAPLGGNAADVCARMIDLSTGLYSGVVQPDYVDSVEYQHSLGAALSARDALVAGRAALRARNAARYDEAMREMDRFVALWPQVAAPEQPTPNRDVLAQASRVKLALSSFLE